MCLLPFGCGIRWQIRSETAQGQISITIHSGMLLILLAEGSSTVYRKREAAGHHKRENLASHGRGDGESMGLSVGKEWRGVCVCVCLQILYDSKMGREGGVFFDGRQRCGIYFFSILMLAHTHLFFFSLPVADWDLLLGYLPLRVEGSWCKITHTRQGSVSPIGVRHRKPLSAFPDTSWEVRI